MSGPEVALGTAGVVVLATALAGAGVSALGRQRSRVQALTGMAALSGGVALVFALADALLLWSLPRLGLSFGPVRGPALGIVWVVRLGLLGLLGLVAVRARERRWRGAVALFLFANLALTGGAVYAYVVEPLWIETTYLEVTSGDLETTAPPVRIVHLTDLHVERYGPREAAVVEQVAALEPDLIVLTGDYLNMSNLSDPAAVAGFRRLAAQLHAPYGIYAVRGNVDPWPERMAELVEGTGITWLEQETAVVEVRGQRLALLGVACSWHEQNVAWLAQTAAGVARDEFTLLLFHSPDLIAEAAGLGVDLYLAGHTHGGQIALPFYGPVITFSRYGRQYARGEFQVGETTMYVSRGLGFEGGSAPRARFLARPEIVVVEVGGIRY
ncbi:MAG: metallophosphoesterase [Anaerolineae bacterium]|nr:metallophosphoesterase [Anaerolineae bacterium]